MVRGRSTTAKSSLLLSAFLLCAVSCTEPVQGESYVRGPRRYYEFTLDVEDSLALYDISFCCRYAARIHTDSQMCIGVRWTSPQDSVYSEKVWMKLDRGESCVKPYRARMNFPRSGEWTLRLTPQGHEDDMVGMGIEWRKYYGTR